MFQKIQYHLQVLRTLRFIHVRRKANKLVDILANQAVTYKDNEISMSWRSLPQSNLKGLFHNQVEEDKKVYQNITKDANTQ